MIVKRYKHSLTVGEKLAIAINDTVQIVTVTKDLGDGYFITKEYGKQNILSQGSGCVAEERVEELRLIVNEIVAVRQRHAKEIHDLHTRLLDI